MLRHFLNILLATLARALIAYACGEAIHLLLEYIAPDAPPAVYMAVRMLTRIAIVELMVRIEIAVAIRRRRDDPQ